MARVRGQVSDGAACRRVGAVMAERDIMTVKEAAEYLGIKPSTLYKYIKQGVIPAFKIGSLWRFKKSALDRWISKKLEEAEETSKGDRRQPRLF